MSRGPNLFYACVAWGSLACLPSVPDFLAFSSSALLDMPQRRSRHPTLQSFPSHLQPAAPPRRAHSFARRFTRRSPIRRALSANPVCRHKASRRVRCARPRSVRSPPLGTLARTPPPAACLPAPRQGRIGGRWSTGARPSRYASAALGIVELTVRAIGSALTVRKESIVGLFTGKTVIVTGGGKATLKDGSAGSIGYGIDIAFAKEGANLVITGRNVAKLEAAKESLEAEYGIKVLPVAADVSAGQDNEAVVQHVVDETIATFGRIDALVNNAQASASGVTIADHTMEQFDLAIYSGLYATFLYMQKCYPYLKETKGSVVNFASGAGLFGNYGQCSYAAAKEGIRGLTRVAANEWGADGINVNIVCPLAWTAQLENFKDSYPEAFEANVHMPPAGHYGDSELEIGRVVVQLCGPDFKYMNGETLTLEGGMGQRP